jgi:hypothetical protein
MFDFNKFYAGLLIRSDYCSGDNYWDQFPEGQLLQFKGETLPLLKKNIRDRNVKGLESILAIIFYDGADRDYINILLSLLDEQWHNSVEDIVSILEIIKDPKSVDKLYELAINVPDYDDMRALAKKCMWALRAINTPEAIDKIKLLAALDDEIIKANAVFHLSKL